MPVKFQSNSIIQTTNLTAYDKTSYHVLKRGPDSVGSGRRKWLRNAEMKINEIAWSRILDNLIFTY